MSPPPNNGRRRPRAESLERQTINQTDVVESVVVVGQNPAIPRILLNASPDAFRHAKVVWQMSVQVTMETGQVQGKQLMHPSSMGEKFWVLVQKKEAELPENLKSIPNRIKRLTT